MTAPVLTITAPVLDVRSADTLFPFTDDNGGHLPVPTERAYAFGAKAIEKLTGLESTGVRVGSVKLNGIGVYNQGLDKLGLCEIGTIDYDVEGQIVRVLFITQT